MIIFLFSLILGYSARKFFIFWIRLEISGLCVIPLFWSRCFTKNTFFYFLVTAFSGAFLFLSWIKCWYFLRCFIIFFKVGVWPFSFWVIEIAQNLDFLSGYIFLFLVKFLPFYGLFNFFSTYFYCFISVALLNLLGSSLKLYTEKYYDLYNIFLWMSVRSVSYWLLIGIYSFYLFLICYILYRSYMFFILFYQNKYMINFDLWITVLLLFLGGPPLIYLFFKIFFFYSLPKKFFIMRLLRFVFFFQRVVMIRALMFSAIRQK